MMLTKAYWQPIETAPRDGSLVRLLIAADDDRDNALDDSAEPTATIGFNNFVNDEMDEWRFAGWDWSQDEFTAGVGTVIGWASWEGPLPAGTQLGAPAQDEAA